MISAVIYFIITQFFKFFIIKVIFQFLIDIYVKEEFGSIVDSIQFLLVFYDFLSVWIKISVFFNTIVIINDIFI